MFLVFFTFGTLDFREVAAAAAAMPRETAGFGVLSVICLLLFMGAAGKSAQIPLHVWLPDAMEGPTPVSALIHAATMVTAGVYMVARNAVLFEHAPLVMQIVAIVGALTALMAATIGLVQNDIKRVLAYSTVSQLGYMFLAAGVGAFAAAVFHLVTHAFFKALLFLGSGSVIHAMAGEQDMQRMGGLRKYMPVTFVTMMIGTLALAGIPPLSGFFSKDEILVQAFARNRILWGIAVATARPDRVLHVPPDGADLLRLVPRPGVGARRIARGPRRQRQPRRAASARRPRARAGGAEGARGHARRRRLRPDAVRRTRHAWRGPHEAPGAMTVPLMALAVGAIVAGFIGIPPALGGINAIDAVPRAEFSAAAGPAAARPRPAFNPAPDATGCTRRSGAADRADDCSRSWCPGAGFLTARHFYISTPELPARARRRSGPACTRCSSNKYYVDELYDSTIVRGTLASARGLWSARPARSWTARSTASAALTQIGAWFSHMFDKHVVDGAGEPGGWSAGRGSFGIRRVQTGLVQNYALLMVAGLFVFLTVYLLAR